MTRVSVEDPELSKYQHKNGLRTEVVSPKFSTAHNSTIIQTYSAPPSEILSYVEILKRNMLSNDFSMNKYNKSPVKPKSKLYGTKLEPVMSEEKRELIGIKTSNSFFGASSDKYQ